MLHVGYIRRSYASRRHVTLALDPIALLLTEALQHTRHRLETGLPH